MPCLLSGNLVRNSLFDGYDTGASSQLTVMEKCTATWLRKQLEMCGSDQDDEEATVEGRTTTTTTTSTTTGVVILDCRSSNEFNAGHIIGAVHLLLPAILLRRLRNGKLSVEQMRKQSGVHEGSNWTGKTLVLYDDGSQDFVDNPNSTASLLLNRMREDCYAAYLLEGGYNAFHEHHPHLCAGVSTTDSTILGLRSLVISTSRTTTTTTRTANERHLLVNDDDMMHDGGGCGDMMEEETVSEPFPVEVLPGLFLGNRQCAEDMETLLKHNIRYVVNVTEDVPNHFEGTSDFRYLQIPITDNIKENLASYFPRANAFIDEARAAKVGVLVHCLAGISRSVTVTCAYLMHNLHLNFNDSFALVKRKKTDISPNFNFLGQLLDYQERLKCTCPPSCVAMMNMGGGAGLNASGAESSSTLLPPPLAVSSDCSCSCHDNKCFFTSPTVMSCTSTSSTCTSSSLEFDYDVPPTPS